MPETLRTPLPTEVSLPKLSVARLLTIVSDSGPSSEKSLQGSRARMGDLFENQPKVLGAPQDDSKDAGVWNSLIDGSKEMNRRKPISSSWDKFFEIAEGNDNASQQVSSAEPVEWTVEARAIFQEHMKRAHLNTPNVRSMTWDNLNEIL